MRRNHLLVFVASILCAGCAAPVNHSTPPVDLLTARAEKDAVQAHGKEAAHKSTDPFSVLSELVRGNDRYIAGHGNHPHQSPDVRLELAKGQHPKAIILSCSDSRVPPELVFDQGLGDLFVIRTAGEVADSAGLASIEYAIEHLHSPLIVVLGHEACGAVKATIGTPEGKSAGSEHLDKLVADIRPHLASVQTASHDTFLNVPVRAQVDGAAQDLVKKSKILSHAVEAGEVRIVRGVYRLETGKVDFWH